MKILLRYHQRLGDIIQCLSMARQLSLQNYEMYFECLPEYHSIFKLCPYVMPVYPGQVLSGGFKFDEVIDPQIWPTRYQDYLQSKMKWWNFVVSLHPLLSGLLWRNPFELSFLPQSPIHEPEKYVVIAHTGFSQVPKIKPRKVIALADKLYPDLSPLTLGPQGTFRATDLCDLVSLVAKAGAVVTINTSVTYMADATRSSYDHIIETGFNEKADLFSLKQTRHRL